MPFQILENVLLGTRNSRFASVSGGGRYCFDRRFSMCVFVNRITKTLGVDSSEILGTDGTREELVKYWKVVVRVWC